MDNSIAGAIPLATLLKFNTVPAMTPNGVISEKIMKSMTPCHLFRPLLFSVIESEKEAAHLCAMIATNIVTKEPTPPSTIEVEPNAVPAKNE